MGVVDKATGATHRDTDGRCSRCFGNCLDLWVGHSFILLFGKLASFKRRK